MASWSAWTWIVGNGGEERFDGEGCGGDKGLMVTWGCDRDSCEFVAEKGQVAMVIGRERVGIVIQNMGIGRSRL